jgi:hypothetical protein
MVVERRKSSNFRLLRYLLRDRRHTPIGAIRSLAILAGLIVILLCVIVISASDSPFSLVLRIGG